MAQFYNAIIVLEGKIGSMVQKNVENLPQSQPSRSDGLQLVGKKIPHLSGTPGTVGYSKDCHKASE